MNKIRGALWIIAAALTLFAAGSRSQDAAPLVPTFRLPAPRPAAQQAASTGATQSEEAPPASQTGGFDGAKAYDYTAKLVSFGPHPPGTDAIRHTQEYIRAQLRGFGCAVDADDFHAQTPIGTLPMENIVAKIPGTGQGIILLLTHYDTLRTVPNFLGAVDGGSSSGLMLEMARVLCGEKKKQPNSVWIAFLDGEEAQVHWTEDDSVYGARELAASMALSGDLKRVKAVILADMVGPKNLTILRESQFSTPWLTELVWTEAKSLGYEKIFLDQRYPVDDDHRPFKERGVPVVDIIDLRDYPYWHTPQDTMDKVSARSLAIVGHVILESVRELQREFH